MSLLTQEKAETTTKKVDPIKNNGSYRNPFLMERDILSFNGLHSHDLCLPYNNFLSLCRVIILLP